MEFKSHLEWCRFSQFLPRPTKSLDQKLTLNVRGNDWNWFLLHGWTLTCCWFIDVSLRYKPYRLPFSSYQQAPLGKKQYLDTFTKYFLQSTSIVPHDTASRYIYQILGTNFQNGEFGQCNWKKYWDIVSCQTLTNSRDVFEEVAMWTRRVGGGWWGLEESLGRGAE